MQTQRQWIEKLQFMAIAASLIVSMAVRHSAHAAAPSRGSVPNAPNCSVLLLTREARLEPIRSQQEALETMEYALVETFGHQAMQELEWYRLLHHFALPALRARSPLLVTAIIGGGSAGKSTIMNSLPALLDESGNERTADSHAPL